MPSVRFASSDAWNAQANAVAAASTPHARLCSGSLAAFLIVAIKREKLLFTGTLFFFEFFAFFC